MKKPAIFVSDLSDEEFEILWKLSKFYRPLLYTKSDIPTFATQFTVNESLEVYSHISDMLSDREERHYSFQSFMDSWNQLKLLEML